MNKGAMLAVIAAFALGGCAKHDANYELSAYDHGFNDGCESGVWYDLTDIKKKDYQQASVNRGYFHGWDEGFSECRYNIYRPKA